MTSSIVALTAAHRRDDFDCGNDALNEFLRRYARQQQDRDFNRTYVALADDALTVTAFVSVGVGQVGAPAFPSNLKLPRYPVPVFRIARLAVDRRAQGRQLGRDLVRFGLNLAQKLAGRVGIFAVVVDAKDESAGDFYRRLGFAALSDMPLSLFLPMATLRRARPDRAPASLN